MNKVTLPRWMSTSLPSTIEKLSELEAITYFQRFKNLTEERKCQSITLPWPKKELVTKAILDGFDLTESNAISLERIFAELAPTGVVFWGSYDTELGFYKAKFNSQLLDWVSRELIVSPVSFIAIDNDVILIMDESLMFTLIGFNLNLRDSIENHFGDDIAMKSRFIKNLEEDYQDKTDPYYKWIKLNILPYCKWDSE